MHQFDTISKTFLENFKEVNLKSISRGSIVRDPLQIKVRLYIQIGEVLRQLENNEGTDGEQVTIRERIAALTAIGRLQSVLIDKGKDDDDIAGSSVRKYESAFKNGARGRKRAVRSVDPEPDDDTDAEPDGYGI
jgi:hypothetical protein